MEREIKIGDRFIGKNRRVFIVDEVSFVDVSASSEDGFFKGVIFPVWKVRKRLIEDAPDGKEGERDE